MPICHHDAACCPVALTYPVGPCLSCAHTKVLSVPLPLLRVIPIEASKLKLQNTFKTPVYVTSARR